MKVKCIIKRPNEEFGHVTNISTTLEELQNTVDGPIEMVYLRNNLVLICNEEGKIRHLPSNFHVKFRGGTRDVIVGNVLVVGTEGEDLADIPISLDDWKTMLKEWGN